MDKEARASAADRVALDVLRQAEALFEWAFETRYTDPRPEAVAEAADALENDARALRELEAQPR